MRRVFLKIPGKIVISGDWAVVFDKSPCIALATPPVLEIEIKKKEGKEEVFFPQFSLRGKFSQKKFLWQKKLSQKEKEIFEVPRKALEVVFSYLKEIKKPLFSFEIKIKKKEGSGTSSALTLGLIKGILKFYKIKNKRKILKLSLISHFLAQGEIGSGVDVATSLYGGVIFYKRFKKEWLKENLKKLSLKEIISKKWPGLYVKRLNFPSKVYFLFGFSKKRIPTIEIIKKVKKLKKGTQKSLEATLKEIGYVVRKLSYFWKKESPQKILELLQKNASLLKKIEKETKIKIFTSLFKKAQKIAQDKICAIKTSGWGGGDVIFGVFLKKEDLKEVKKYWENLGLFTLSFAK